MRGVAEGGRDHGLGHPAPAGADRAWTCPQTRPSARKSKARAPRRRRTGARRFPAQDRSDPKDQLEDPRRRDTWFAVSRKAGQGHRRGAGRSDPRDHPRLPLAQVDALGRGLASTESLRWVQALLRASSPFWGKTSSMRSRGRGLGLCHQGPPLPPSRARSPSAAHDYADKLRACHVIVDHEERRNLIRDKPRQGAAAAAGLTLVEDEGPGDRERGPHRMAGAAARPASTRRFLRFRLKSSSLPRG
jgi:hypothetical protein